MGTSRLPLTCSVVRHLGAGVRGTAKYVWLVFECSQAKLTVGGRQAAGHRCVDLHQLDMLPYLTTEEAQ